MTEAELLVAIEDRIVGVVPTTISSASLPEPIYAAVIQYFGLDSDGDLTPTLRMPTCSRREAIVDEKGDTAPHYVWCHDEFDDDHRVIDASLDDTELARVCAIWYEELRTQNTTLTELRCAIQRAARRLNESVDCFANLAVSDDFIVYPGDMAHEFQDPFGDLFASVSSDTISAFRERRLIGADPWWKLS